MKRLVLIAACVLALSACGGSGGNSATDQIKSAYTTFFSTKTSVDAHVALMQDGAKFKPVIKKFFDNPFANGASATVSSVTLKGPKEAKVIFDVKTAIGSLTNQTGYAVLQDGKWKIADSTLCQLVMLAGTTPPACLA